MLLFSSMFIYELILFTQDPLNIDFSNNPELKKLQLYGPGPKFQGLGLVAGGDKKQGEQIITG